MSLSQKVLTLFAVSVFAFGGCSAQGSSGKSGCARDNDCPGEQLCVNHRCSEGSQGSCGNDFDCEGDDFCVNNLCVNASGIPSNSADSGSSDSILESYKGGIPIKTGTTDLEGRILFKDAQTEDDVLIQVNDVHKGDVLNNVRVDFFDGNGFEGFLLQKSGYVVHFEVFPHNSGHEFNLVPGNFKQLTTFDYYHDENPTAYGSFLNFIGWAKNNYVYRGCMTKEELIKGREDTMAVFSYAFTGNVGLGGLIKFAATVIDKILGLEEKGIIDTMPYDTYDVYDPLHFTAPPILEGREGKTCGGQMCTSHASQECSGNGVYWKDSCGQLEEMAYSCNSDEYCNDGSCYTLQPTCTSHDSKTCSNGNVYFKDSCGNLEDVAQYCNGDEVCNNSSCVTTVKPHFMDKGDGTIFDTITGLVWEKNTGGSLSWQTGIDYCFSLILAGNDWEMPTPAQLITIMDQDSSGCKLFAEFKGGCGRYWTSSECSIFGKAEFRFFNQSSGYLCESKDQPLEVRCVKK